jgi:cytochrome c
MLRRLVLSVTLVLAAALPAAAELRGHGGPVRAVAITPEGGLAVSGSFDTSIIVWSLVRGAALEVKRHHDGAVNALAVLPDGRFVSAGDDGRLVLFRLGAASPAETITGHTAPVAALAVAPDGLIASAGWDRTVRLTKPDGTPERVIEGHDGPVNAVGFLADGSIVSAGYDAQLRITPRGEAPPRSLTLDTPLNALAVAPDGEIVLAGADGVVRIHGPDLTERRRTGSLGAPVIALALSPDGRRIAAASVRGTVKVFDRATLRDLTTLVGPGLPVWSLAFRGDGTELITGGGDRLVRRWNTATGEHIGAVLIAPVRDLLAEFAGDRGAEVFRACAACHTLTPDDGNRAGPTLHGVFGRRIGTAPGYSFSPALTQMDIVWNAETIAKLFEIGPTAMTPGTKMPEQVIGNAEDRTALVRFLERATAVR